MRRIAKGVLAMGLSYDLILSSPYVRAKQTAEIVAQVLSTPEGVMFAEALTPEATPRVHRDAAHRSSRAAGRFAGGP